MAANESAGAAKTNGAINKTNGGGSTTSKGSRSSVGRPKIIVGDKPGPGRPPKADAKAYVDAIKRQYPPDMVMQMMQSAWETAEDTNSWRGKEAIIKLIVESTVGKPVKRVESSGDTSLADLLANVDTSKPLLSIGSDKGQYHKLSSDGAEVGGQVDTDGSGGESDVNVSGDDE